MAFADVAAEEEVLKILGFRKIRTRGSVIVPSPPARGKQLFERFRKAFEIKLYAEFTKGGYAADVCVRPSP